MEAVLECCVGLDVHQDTVVACTLTRSRLTPSHISVRLKEEHPSKVNGEMLFFSLFFQSIDYPLNMKF